jgi:hypothetical protein
MAGTQLLPIALLTLLALSANNASAQQDTAPAAQHGPNEVLRNPVGQVNSMKVSRGQLKGHTRSIARLIRWVVHILSQSHKRQRFIAVSASCRKVGQEESDGAHPSDGHKTRCAPSALQSPHDCEAHLELRSDGQLIQSGVIECALNSAVGLGALYEVLDIFERSRAILLHRNGNTGGLERAIENA